MSTENNKGTNWLEQAAAAKGINMNTAVNGSQIAATMAAAYYGTLVGNGVPGEHAATITAAYVSAAIANKGK